MKIQEKIQKSPGEHLGHTQRWPVCTVLELRSVPAFVPENDEPYDLSFP